MRTHGTILLIVIMMLVSATAVPAGPKDNAELAKAEKLFKQGRDALLAGDYTQAIDLLKKAVAADETKTSYRLSLARAYRYAKKHDQAEEQLRQILKATPDHVEAGQLLGEIYSERKNWKAVVATVEPLLKYRHDYMAYHMLAVAKYHLEDHEKARKYFEEAIKLNPGSAKDYYQLGNIYLAGDFYALAAEAYQKALGLGVDSPVLRYKFGSALFNLRNYFGRISVVTVKAGKIDTISGDWYLIEPVPGKSDTFRVASSNSAIYQVAKAMADGLTDRPDIHFLKANIYLNARRYNRAYEMFGKLEEKIAKEDKALFRYYYAQAAFGIGEYDEYFKHLNKAIELDKAAYGASLVEGYLKVAEQYNQAGDLTKYIHYLDLAVKASPQTASYHLKLGHAYAEARKHPQAVRHWQMVLDLEPDHPQRMKLLNLISKHRKGKI